MENCLKNGAASKLISRAIHSDSFTGHCCVLRPQQQQQQQQQQWRKVQCWKAGTLAVGKRDEEEEGDEWDRIKVILWKLCKRMFNGRLFELTHGKKKKKKETKGAMNGRIKVIFMPRATATTQWLKSLLAIHQLTGAVCTSVSWFEDLSTTENEWIDV